MTIQTYLREVLCHYEGGRTIEGLHYAGIPAIELRMVMYPQPGPEAEKMLAILREWMLKGSADLDFAEPPPAHHPRA